MVSEDFETSFVKEMSKHWFFIFLRKMQKIKSFTELNKKKQLKTSRKIYTGC
jgi:hypothetical protein